MESLPCPICKVNHNTLSRYPNSVCNDCLKTHGTKDHLGNTKSFYNRDITGGIIGFINGVETSDYSCFVNSIKCMAAEARFGGIVISRSYEAKQMDDISKDILNIGMHQ